MRCNVQVLFAGSLAQRDTRNLALCVPENRMEKQGARGTTFVVVVVQLDIMTGGVFATSRTCLTLKNHVLMFVSVTQIISRRSTAG